MLFNFVSFSVGPNLKYCMLKFKTEAIKHVASQVYRPTSRKCNATKKNWISEFAQKAINITGVISKYTNADTFEISALV